MKRFFLGICTCFLFSACTHSIENITHTENTSLTEENSENKNDVECRAKKEEKIISGNSMYPLFSEGESVEYIPEYYTLCSALPQKGDIVQYTPPEIYSSVIKKIVAVEGDRVLIKGGILFVNDEKVENSAGEKYLFSTEESEIIAKSTSNGILKENTVLLLGENIYSSLDSRVFGAIEVSKLEGLFAK